MKVKFKYAEGLAVFDLHLDEANMDEVIALVKNPDILSLSITKETTAQYLKRKSKEAAAT